MPDYSVPTAPILDSAQLQNVLSNIESMFENLGDRYRLGPLFLFAAVKDMGHGTSLVLPATIDRLLIVSLGSSTMDLVLGSCAMVEDADKRRQPIPPDNALLHRRLRTVTGATSLRKVFAVLEESRCTVFTQTFAFPRNPDPLLFGFVRSAETVRDVQEHMRAKSLANRGVN